MNDGFQPINPATPVPPFPAAIVKAICQIKATVEAVKKNQRNQHGGYQFASTDDIYAAVARKMGEVGLICLPLEVSNKIDRKDVPDPKGGTKTVAWLSVVNQFVLAVDDFTWTHETARRSLTIQYTGPQTYQAATSYTEKAWLRTLFKLPTGDMDLDGFAQAETLEDQDALNCHRKRKSSSASKKDGTAELFNEIRGKIAEAPNAHILQQIRTLYAEEWSTLPTRWSEMIEDEYTDRMAAVAGQ